MTWFPWFRNAFTVIDDIRVIAFASIFTEVGGVSVVAFEFTRIGIALADGCGEGDCVLWVVAFLLLFVGVDLSNEVLFNCIPAVDLGEFSNEDVLLKEEVDGCKTDTCVETT